ncbi:MAG: PAS domain-containing protein [Desulfobacterales bacterium]|nr:PAS domain-containing protein [Desulfobacterales bacterium]
MNHTSEYKETRKGEQHLRFRTEQRRARMLNIIALISMPVVAILCGIYATNGEWTGFYFGLSIIGVLACALFGIKKGWSRAVYISGAVSLSLLFLLIIAIGTGAPNNVFWIFLIPMLYYMFLDIITATLLLFTFTAAVVVLMLKPDLLNTHVYENHLILRFIVTYTLISIMAWTYEATRNSYETALVRQNTRIKKQKDFLSILLETMPNPVFFKDTEGKYLGCNKAFEDLLNRSRDSIIGKTAYDICPIEKAEFFDKKDSDLFGSPGRQIYETVIKTQTDSPRDVVCYNSTYSDESGQVQGLIGAIFDITDRKQAEAEKSRLISELESALTQIKTLSGMLPICSSCKKIRDDKGYWRQIETYIESHSQALFSHSICPDCSKKMYGDQPWFDELDLKK